MAKSSQTVTAVIPTGVKNSCFEFRIERNGRYGDAELTYNLNEKTRARALLRMNEGDALHVFPELKSNRDFNQFRDQVKELHSSGLGNMSIAKGLVLQQYDSAFANPELGIAVHRMGPVPVFLLSEDLTGPLPSLPINNHEVHPSIGVYPSIIANSSASKLVKPDLLRSFGIQLDLMLTKYLEDVGEHFHDIENYLPRIDVFRRAKEVEGVLKQSIQQKVDLILQHAQSDLQKELYPLAKKTWEQFSPAIVTAAFARVFALHLLNELYKVLGVADKSAKYEHDWERLEETFENLLGESEFQHLFASGTELSLLRDSRSHFLAHSEDAEFEAQYSQAEARGITWIQQFVAFARFVAGILREGASVGTGRVFVSLQHNVAAASNLYQSVSSYVEKKPRVNGRPAAQVLAVNSESAGSDIERLIKSRIWISDSLLAIVPKDWDDLKQGREKDLTWVVREVDHALLLERLLTLFVEDGADRKNIALEFGKDVDPIAPSLVRYGHKHRKERRLRHLEKLVNASFAYCAETQLNDALKSEIDKVLQAARERHTRDVIIGFLRQFEDSKMVAKILKLTSSPRTKSWICDQIANERRVALRNNRLYGNLRADQKDRIRAEIERDVKKYRRRIGSRFNQARLAMEKRGLLIGGQVWQLLSTTGSTSDRTYHSNLKGILQSLMPDSDTEHVDEMNKRVFKLVLEESPH